MVYYVEYIFAENFFIDFLLLFITGKILRRKINYKRLLLSAFIGASYVVIHAFYKFIFLNNVSVNFSVSVLMIVISYDTKGIRSNFQNIIGFYIVSLVMVGILTALYYTTNDKLTVNAIIISLFFGYGALHLFFKETKKRKDKIKYLRTINIKIKDKKFSLVGFIDTGNELKDPLTNKSVIIVSISSLKNIIEENIHKDILDFYLNEDKDYEKLLLKYSDEYNLRAIKFKTINTSGNTMICIVPDCIHLQIDKKTEIKLEAILGLNPNNMSNMGEYEALLYKKLLELESEVLNESQTSS